MVFHEMVLLGIAMANAQPPNALEPIPMAQMQRGARLQELQGLWQKKDILYDEGAMSARDPEHLANLRECLVIAGDNLYRVTGGVGAMVFRRKIVMGGPADHIDIVDPDNNRTVRCLYKFLPAGLALCQNDWGKTLLRPQKVEAAPDGFIVHVFARSLPPEAKAEGKEAGRVDVASPFAGLWHTVGFQKDGLRLEEEKNRLLFMKECRVFYFANSAYAMFETEGLLRLKMTHQPFHLRPKEGKNAVDFIGTDGKAIPAIFERDGDTLRICWNGKAGDRPDAMRTEAGDGRELIVLERVDGKKTERELPKGVRDGS